MIFFYLVNRELVGISSCSFSSSSSSISSSSYSSSSGFSSSFSSSSSSSALADPTNFRIFFFALSWSGVGRIRPTFFFTQLVGSWSGPTNSRPTFFFGRELVGSWSDPTNSRPTFFFLGGSWSGVGRELVGSDQLPTNFFFLLSWSGVGRELVGSDQLGKIRSSEVVLFYVLHVQTTCFILKFRSQPLLGPLLFTKPLIALLFLGHDYFCHA